MSNVSLFDRLSSEGRQYLNTDEYPEHIKEMIRDGYIGKDEKVPINQLLVSKPMSLEDMNPEQRQTIIEIAQRLQEQIKAESA